MPDYRISLQILRDDGLWHPYDGTLLWDEGWDEVTAYLCRSFRKQDLVPRDQVHLLRYVVIDGELGRFPEEPCPEDPIEWKGLPAGLPIRVVLPDPLQPREKEPAP